MTKTEAGSFGRLAAAKKTARTAKAK